MIKIRLLILLLILFSAETIFGCMCGRLSVSEMYENSDAVVIARAISFKPAIVYDEWTYEDEDKNVKKVQKEFSGQEVKIEISKSFKGIDRKRFIKLSQPNSLCDWNFDNEDLNKSLLLYLRFDEKHKTYSIISCSRSTSVIDAADDLSWLNGLPKSLDRTRISGIVKFNDDDNLFPRVSGIGIKISGRGKEYNLVSDENGLYEIWDLPNGIYSINAEIPKDKKLGWTTSVPDNWTYFWNLDVAEPNALKVTLKAKSCAGIDFMLEEK